MPQKTFILPLCIVLVTFNCGCISSTQPMTSVPPPTETVEITQTTTLPSSTSTYESTLTQTNTYIPVPTLSPDNAYTRLRALLNDSANCTLPCWLGITPGKSTWQEANEELMLFSGIANGLYIETGANKWSSGFLTVPNTSNTLVIEIRMSYPTSFTDNVVSLISAESRAYKLKDGNYDGDVYGSSAYHELIEPYTIASVFTSFGKPKNIYILGVLRDDTLVTPAVGDHFVIHVWYPERGIFLAYKMSVEGVGGNYHFCPSDALFSGYLLKPGLISDYKDVLINLDNLYQYFFPPFSKYVKSIPEAFGITEEEFFQFFRSPTDRCLETPISLWKPK